MSSKVNLESEYLDEEVHVSMKVIEDLQKLAAEQKVKIVESRYNRYMEQTVPSLKHNSSEIEQMIEISEDFEFFEE